jgi:hypothetical protein
MPTLLYSLFFGGRQVKAERNQYDAVLSDLREQRKKIDDAISALEGLAGLLTPGSPAAGVGKSNDAPTEIASDTFFQLGVGEAIKKYLRMVGRKQTTKEISDALKRGGVEAGYSGVTTALIRGEERGEISKVKRGEWGLPEFYNKEG